MVRKRRRPATPAFATQSLDHGRFRFNPDAAAAQGCLAYLLPDKGFNWVSGFGSIPGSTDAPANAIQSTNGGQSWILPGAGSSPRVVFPGSMDYTPGWTEDDRFILPTGLQDGNSGTLLCHMFIYDRSSDYDCLMQFKYYSSSGDQSGAIIQIAPGPDQWQCQAGTNSDTAFRLDLANLSVTFPREFIVGYSYQFNGLCKVYSNGRFVQSFTTGQGTVGHAHPKGLNCGFYGHSVHYRLALYDRYFSDAEHWNLWADPAAWYSCFELSGRTTYSIPAAATSAISGSADMLFGAGSSTLTGVGSISGLCPVQIIPTGALVLPGLSGVSALIFTSSGSDILTGTGALAGTCNVGFGAGSSTLTGKGALAGAANVQFGTSAVLSGNILADWNVSNQVIDGFGAAFASFDPSGTGSIAALTDARADLFFSPTAGIGLSICRGMTPFDSTTPSVYEKITFQKAQARGAKIFAAPWSPPAVWKDNGTVDNTGPGGDGTNFFTSSHNTDYSNFLRDWILLANSFGITIDFLSLQNEPDISRNYPTCKFTADQFRDFLLTLKPILNTAGITTKLMAGEMSSWDFSINNSIYADSTALSYIDIIASHTYGVTNPGPVADHGKKVWQTEVSDFNTFDATMTSGLSYADQIHNFLTNAQGNAWIYWWGLSSASDNENLIQEGTPDIITKRFYALGNYSKFVRPNFIRIGVTNPSSLKVTAFKNTATNEFSLVVVNDGSSSSNSYQLSNFPFIPGTVTPYLTDSTHNLAAQTPLSITSNSFSYSHPASSVVTFVFQAGGMAGSASMLFTAGPNTITGKGALLGNVGEAFGAGSSNLTGTAALAGAAPIAVGAVQQRVTVSAAGDDAAYQPGTAFTAGATQGDLGNNGGAKGAWFRFSGGPAIPSGTVITRATLYPKVNSASASGDILIKSYCELATNPAIPSDVTDADSRTLTTGTAKTITLTGNIPTIALDITAEVQAVVNQGGWSSGNAINVVVKDNGTASGKFIRIGFIEGNAANAAVLEVVYTSVTSNLTSAGALAGSASLQFTGILTGPGIGVLSGAANLSFAAGSSTISGTGALLGSAPLITTAGNSTLTGTGALAGHADTAFGFGSTSAYGIGGLVGNAPIQFTATSSALGAGALSGSAGMIFAPTLDTNASPVTIGAVLSVSFIDILGVT